MMSRYSRLYSSASSARKELDRSSPVMTLIDLEHLLCTGKSFFNRADEVWPRLYLGDRDFASDHRELAMIGITHILNCAHVNFRGGAENYEGMNITYQGIEARDSPTFDMSVHFHPAAEFIHKALISGGKILVHCAAGVSRSATLVLAYLMIRQNMTLVDAIKTVNDRHSIFPNRGFLRQLTVLDSTLHRRYMT
ncbi:dual specificity protein phosphatase 26-like [Megalops cyprinoides]|uniref:dual specificity protein phosphatase 26-like n=1 Tax=Megalops cyprinoides TaxID=118141 RepID=UPI001864ACDD|nr:dual specificity protein phosphatase 26-like [Megalops cyprinoides]